MSAEDIVQFSDFGWIDVTVTGTGVVVNAKQGPIGDITAPANGQLSVTLNDGGVATQDFSFNGTFMQSALLTLGSRSQTDTVKVFDIYNFPAATPRATAYRLKMVFRRKFG